MKNFRRNYLFWTMKVGYFSLKIVNFCETKRIFMNDLRSRISSWLKWSICSVNDAKKYWKWRFSHTAFSQHSINLWPLVLLSQYPLASIIIAIKIPLKVNHQTARFQNSVDNLDSKIFSAQFYSISLPAKSENAIYVRRVSWISCSLIAFELRKYTLAFLLHFHVPAVSSLLFHPPT